MEQRTNDVFWVDTREIVAEILSQWRRILACAIVFAVLLGGYATIKAVILNNEAAAEAAVGSGKLFFSGVKNIIAAFLAGGIIGMLIAGIKYTYSNKIGSEELLRKKYNLVTLGKYVAPSDEATDLIKKKAQALRGFEPDDENYDHALKMLAARLAQVKKANDISLVGTATKDLMETIKTGLESNIEDVAVTVCGDIIRDPDAVKMLGGDKEVLLIESKKSSTDSDLAKELQLLQDTNSKVHGIMLID